MPQALVRALSRQDCRDLLPAVLALGVGAVSFSG